MTSQNLKILAIDDNRDNLMTMKAVVSDALPGALVFTALRGAEGLEIARAQDPDVILLDIIMPDMDGFEVCRRLKADDGLRHIPVVFVTALGTDNECRMRALETGAEGFLSKPLDAAELTAQVRAMAKIRMANRLQELEREQLAALVAERTLELERELTERKRTEESLRKSEERFRQLFENAPIPYQSVDEGGLILEVNKAWLVCLGYRKEDVLGRRFDSFLQPGPEPGPERDFTSLIKAGGNNGLELQMVKKDGSAILVFFNISVATDSAGQMVCAHCVFLDITQHRRLEAELRQAQKMEAVGTLAGGIAHDFNNILAAIIGYAELALDDAMVGKTAPGAIKMVISAADRAKKLIRQILAFSRKGEAVFTPLDLNKVIYNTAALLESTLPKMISLEVVLTDGLDPISGDSTQIEQVILNLANNASDAMPNGGELSISSEMVTLDEAYANQHLGPTQGKYVLITVADTGLGMNKGTQEHIFEPFFTTKGVGKGTGLGLSTAYGIVKLHGGNIICYSEEGAGTTFKIYLPAIQEKKPVIKAMDGHDNAAGLKGVENILLVDDDDALLQLGAGTLQCNGYMVQTACNGEDALEIYRQRGDDLDLVIMDLGMPGMGGHKAFKEILALNPEARVIIASGYSIDGRAKDVLADGASGFVAKPFMRAELLATVRCVLDRK